MCATARKDATKVGQMRECWQKEQQQKPNASDYANKDATPNRLTLARQASKRATQSIPEATPASRQTAEVNTYKTLHGMQGATTNVQTNRAPPNPARTQGYTKKTLTTARARLCASSGAWHGSNPTADNTARRRPYKEPSSCIN